MKKTIIAVSALFLTSTAYAGNFEGLSVFGKAGVKSSEIEIKDGDFSSQDGLGKSDHFGAVGIDYGFKINEKFVALIGAEIDVNDTTLFKISDGGGGFKMKQKNSYGIYVAPGYLVNDSALIYAKFSYNRTKVEGKETFSDQSYKWSDNYDGFGFGVGARLFVAQNIFINTEWQKIRYGSEKSSEFGGRVKFQPESTVGTIGIGYNF